MLRTNLTILFALIFATVCNAEDRPNIVVMMADDIGFECLGAYGNETNQTPNIDLLAKTGMKFQHAHSQPICTPSRVQIMTGIYNNRNYLRFGLLDPEAITFANVLRDAGYETCIAGKWQLEGGLEGPRNFGFDHYCLWQVIRRPSRYPNPGFEIDGKLVDYKEGQFGPDIASDYICNFMEEHQDKPFLVYYPMIPPHWPFVPTPDHKDWDPTMWKNNDKEPGGYKSDKYWKAMVAYTDKMVGKVINKLDELNLREKTLVVCTGDNGTFVDIVTPFQGSNYRGGKGKSTDNGTHVGFVANWPGTIAPGQVKEDLVDFSDVFPTVAEVAGVPVPSEWELDGVSIAPLFHGKPREKSYIYCWYERNGRREKASQHVRDQQYKLYADGRFFDTLSDPLEKSPLKRDQLSDQQRMQKRKLKSALAPHLEKTKLVDERQQEKRKANLN